VRHSRSSQCRFVSTSFILECNDFSGDQWSVRVSFQLWTKCFSAENVDVLNNHWWRTFVLGVSHRTSGVSNSCGFICVQWNHNCVIETQWHRRPVMCSSWWKVKRTLCVWQGWCVLPNCWHPGGNWLQGWQGSNWQHGRGSGETVSDLLGLF